MLRLVGYGLVVLALALTYRPRDYLTLNLLSHWRFTVLGALSFSFLPRFHRHWIGQLWLRYVLFAWMKYSSILYITCVQITETYRLYN